MAWALDLDGVVWRGSEPIPGAGDAVAQLRRGGEPLAFVTNNSARTVDEVVERLAAVDVEARPEEIVSSSQAAASLLEPGQRVLVLGGAGIVEALEVRGVEVLAADGAEASGALDAVVVGLDRALDYARLAAAADGVRRGARFVATNTDATYPSATGLRPGAGSVVAAVAVAAGRDPDVVAGKPHRAMVELVRARLGAAGVVVGDRADTDGALARGLGWSFALVMSGVTSATDLPVDPAPDHVGADLAEIVGRLRG